MSLLKPTACCGCMDLAKGLLMYAIVMMIWYALVLILCIFVFPEVKMLYGITVSTVTSIAGAVNLMSYMFLFLGATTKNRKFVMAYIVMGFVMLDLLVHRLIDFIILLISVTNNTNNINTPEVTYMAIIISINLFIFIVISVHVQLCAISFYGFLNQNHIRA